jgi:hypothetical protein
MTTTSRFVVERQPMICGQAVAQERSYKMAVDSDGCVWLYDLAAKSPAGAIYCDDPNDDKSDGFGGSTLTFKVGKCGKYTAKGPWHSNSDDMFRATGVDLRDKSLTFVVVAKSRTYEGHATVLEDILYADKEPTLGNFSRYKAIAQKFADDSQEPVFYHSESSGGSSNGPVYPTGWTPEQIREWHHPKKD